MSKTSAASHGGITDGGAGCKFVFRHNHCYNVHLTVHGTEGVPRGGRAMEIYNNDFHNTISEDTAGRDTQRRPSFLQ